MYKYLYTLWWAFFDICRLRKGPQDLPDSPALLGLVLAIYAPLQITLNALSGKLAIAFAALVVELSLTWLLTITLLYVMRYPQRLRQTLIALFGTNSIITLLMLPIWLWFWHIFDGNKENPDLGLIGLLILGLWVWNMMILAHIFRHALSTQFVIGVMVALLYTAVFVIAMLSLFPTPPAAT